MADRPTGDGDEPNARQEALRARRDARRRQIRRRRVLAGGALLAGMAAVVLAVVLATGGSDEGGGSGAKVATNSTPPKEQEKGGEATGLVRNAHPQPDWEPHTGPVPILEYHVIGEAPEGAPYPELFVLRPDFRHQMEWLDDNGYEAVTLEQVEEAWFEGGTLPPKPIVISFDDGYRPQYTFALPQLRKHGWAGVINLKAEGSELYESNIEAMLAAGWELASHTINHLDLTELDEETLKEEVAGSRQILRREYGVPVKNFCYPAGEFDETVIAAVQDAGYVGATTEIPGYAESDSPYELARYEILGSTGVTGLAELLASGA